MTNAIAPLRITLAILVVVGTLLCEPSLAKSEAVPQQAPMTGARKANRVGKEPPLVLEGATVIDVQHGTRLPAQRVVIVGNRILAVGSPRSVPLPRGARVIDLRGAFIIPGLWDMHTHVDDQVKLLYPQFLRYGVTGLREMAQRFPGGTDSLRVWQREVMAGTRVGPRVYGPSADNVYLINHGVPMQTPDDIRHVLDSLKAAGVVFLKQHSDGLSRERYFTTAREARRVGLPLVGHLPQSVTEIEASDSGQRSVEHVEENHTCWANWPASLDTLDSAVVHHCAAVAAAYVRNGTWMSPTVVGANYYPEHNVALAQQFVHFMHAHGVPILAGTDFGVDMEETGMRAGQSLLEDVVYLAGAMTPLEGLQAATLNPALFMHATDSLGTVARGKLADLVILGGDPLQDIHNVYQIRAVVANGRYFDRAALDGFLREASTPPK